MHMKCTHFYQRNPVIMIFVTLQSECNQSKQHISVTNKESGELPSRVHALHYMMPSDASCHAPRRIVLAASNQRRGANASSQRCVPEERSIQGHTRAREFNLFSLRAWFAGRRSVDGSECRQWAKKDPAFKPKWQSRVQGVLISLSSSGAHCERQGVYEVKVQFFE